MNFLTRLRDRILKFQRVNSDSGVFLVITHDHGSFGGRHQVEILPTGLPELFKPARDLLEPRKFEILESTFSS